MSFTTWLLLFIGILFVEDLVNRIAKTFIVCNYFKMIGKISEKVDENTASNEFIRLVKDRDSVK